MINQVIQKARKWANNSLTVHTLSKFFNDECRNFFRYGYFCPPIWTVDDIKKIAYCDNYKVANSSIRAGMLENDIETEYAVHSKKTFEREQHVRTVCGRLGKEFDDYYKFTFVRNPFERLVSCYVSKYHTDLEKYLADREKVKGSKYDVFHFNKYFLGILRADNGFDAFVRKVCKIPVAFQDRHFFSQYELTHDRKGNSLFDFIGRFENLNDEYEQIQKKYNLKPLQHFNKSDKSNWMDYYTEETANLVYKKYQKEIQAFYYEQDYKALLSHLNKYSHKIPT